jgi:hypothetical protein
MADTGKLEHSDLREGATLTLTGADGTSKRVFAGPRRSHHGRGVVAVYAEDRPAGWLFASAEDAGRVELKMLGREVPHNETAILDGGSAGDPNGSLALVDLDHLDADGRPEWGAFLGFGRNGPLLLLSGDERTVILSTNGLQFVPDKGDFDLNLVMPLPEKPGLAIHYSVVEGPEVGVQVRGTATLLQGRATVVLPEHFGLVASGSQLTVQLTPRSSRSKGVAASALSTRELVIEELCDGRGSYDVDWFVQGVRKGRETYEVVRPWAAPEVPAPRPRAETGE